MLKLSMNTESLPSLNDKTLGWLTFLHRKVSINDDWSEDGEPLDWWDKTSNPPVLNFARFDLSESSYALGLMADVTPAWREVYSFILKGLSERHLTFWAAYDWLTQIGPDPNRDKYPQEWIDLWIPDHLVGKYDTPGWVANGIEPWGLQKDPIGADGNLFFKGWLNLIQSLHVYTTGEDTWGSSFQVAGVDRSKFDWTQHRLVEHLSSQWTKNRMGPHCENTKIWPYCLSAAGLGLQLYDAIFQKNTHSVYPEWVEHTKDKYYGFDSSGALEWTPIYYDPLIDHIHAAGPSNGLTIAFYMMPQDPVFAEFLYRTAVKKLGWDNINKEIKMKPEPRFMALGLACAKEFGDTTVEMRLRAFAEEHFEPRWFGENNINFGYWFNLNEKWPRGQWAALAMMAEVGKSGAWSNLFRNPNLEKFNAPSLEGVDFPNILVEQAYNEPNSQTLFVKLKAANKSKENSPSKIFIKKIPDLSAVKVKRDGYLYDMWRATGKGSIEIDISYSDIELEIYTGWSGAKKRGEFNKVIKKDNFANESSNIMQSPRSLKIINTSTCPCCTSMGN